MPILKRLILLMWLLLGVTACAGLSPSLQFRTEVDSLVAGNEVQTKKSFVILPDAANANSEDLQFIEFKAYIEKALQLRGFVKANTARESELVLFLSYGVDNPQVHQYSYDVPVMPNMGYYYMPPRMSRYYGAFPPFGMNTYIPRIESYTTFKHHLQLEACDSGLYLQQQQRKQLWKTSVQTIDRSNDLRLVFPYLVAAMQAHIGTNTGHMLIVDIDETDPILRSLIAPYQAR